MRHRGRGGGWSYWFAPQHRSGFYGTTMSRAGDVLILCFTVPMIAAALWSGVSRPGMLTLVIGLVIALLGTVLIGANWTSWRTARRSGATRGPALAIAVFVASDIALFIYGVIMGYS
jgi:hypothetical protein